MLKTLFLFLARFCGTALVAGLLFWFVMLGIDAHMAALERLQTPPIELTRNTK